MLIVFRLDKTTGSTATYTFGREINFKKITLRGVSFENTDPAATDGTGAIPTTAGGLPVYLHLDLFDDNEVLFYQGRNTTLASANPSVDNLIPIAIIPHTTGGAIPFQHMDLKIRDQIGVLESTDTITIKILQLQQGVLTALTTPQMCGADTDDGANAADHGVNLYFEFELTESQDHDQTGAIADAA